MQYMTIVWLVVFVVSLIIEAATAGLASIWFAAGALVALICSVFTDNIWLQIILFVVVSSVLLYYTRPLAKKYLDSRKTATNADRVIGASCLVTEEIDNVEGTGTVSVAGKLWSARSQTGEKIKKGDMAKAVSIEGVKLIVVPMCAEAEQVGDAPCQAAK